MRGTLPGSRDQATGRRVERPPALERPRATEVGPLDDPVKLPAHVRRDQAAIEGLLTNGPRRVWFQDNQIGVEAHIDDAFPAETRKSCRVPAHPVRDLRKRVAPRTRLGP